MNTMKLDKKIDSQGEAILHAFGDSFGHAKTDGSGKMYSSGLGHAMDSIADMMLTGVGALPGKDPDSPYTHYGKYRKMVGTLYDGFAARAQKEGYKPRMGRDEFIGRMLGAAASDPNPAHQEEAVIRLIDHLER